MEDFGSRQIRKSAFIFDLYELLELEKIIISCFKQSTDRSSISMDCGSNCLSSSYMFVGLEGDFVRE